MMLIILHDFILYKPVNTSTNYCGYHCNKERHGQAVDSKKNVQKYTANCKMYNAH